MVSLNAKDYSEILRWFGHMYGLSEQSDIDEQTKRTFWKLHFLAEDYLEEHNDKPKDSNV